jgi:lysylphosphatidylglycerol synthetase-like protein (DUF2156 family)
VVVAGLVGGGLVSVGSRQPWERDAFAPGVPTVPDAYASVTASLGAVILAGTLVVAVTRTFGRRLAGAAVALSAAGVLFVVLAAGADWVLWRVAVLFGAGLALASGVAAAWRGHTWASIGTKYDAPGAAPPREPDPWTAIDRGEDPTA